MKSPPGYSGVNPFHPTPVKSCISNCGKKVQATTVLTAYRPIQQYHRRPLGAPFSKKGSQKIKFKTAAKS